METDNCLDEATSRVCVLASFKDAEATNERQMATMEDMKRKSEQWRSPAALRRIRSSAESRIPSDPCRASRTPRRLPTAQTHVSHSLRNVSADSSAPLRIVPPLLESSERGDILGGGRNAPPMMMFPSMRGDSEEAASILTLGLASSSSSSLSSAGVGRGVIGRDRLVVDLPEERLLPAEHRQLEGARHGTCESRLRQRTVDDSSRRQSSSKTKRRREVHMETETAQSTRTTITNGGVSSRHLFRR